MRCFSVQLVLVTALLAAPAVWADSLGSVQAASQEAYEIRNLETAILAIARSLSRNSDGSDPQELETRENLFQRIQPLVKKFRRPLAIESDEPTLEDLVAECLDVQSAPHNKTHFMIKETIIDALYLQYRSSDNGIVVKGKTQEVETVVNDLRYLLKELALFGDSLNRTSPEELFPASEKKIQRTKFEQMKRSLLKYGKEMAPPGHIPGSVEDFKTHFFESVRDPQTGRPEYFLKPSVWVSINDAIERHILGLRGMGPCRSGPMSEVFQSQRAR